MVVNTHQDDVMQALYAEWRLLYRACDAKRVALVAIDEQHGERLPASGKARDFLWRSTCLPGRYTVDARQSRAKTAD